MIEVNVNLSVVENTAHGDSSSFTPPEEAEASHRCTPASERKDSKNSNSNSETSCDILYYDDNKNNTSNEQKKSKEELSCASIIWLRRQKRQEEGKHENYDDTRPPPESNTTKGKLFSYGFHACAKYSDYDNEDETTTTNTTATFAKSSSLFFQKLHYTEDEMLMEDGDEPLEESDLRPKIVDCDQQNDYGIGKESKTMKKIRCRSFHIVTTAALPWMTGTAVNPLLRAAYLNKMNRDAVKKFLKFLSSSNNSYGKEPSDQNEKLMGSVTLCIPWLVDEADRKTVYGEKFSFDEPKDQEEYIREWLSESAKLPLEASLETNGIKIV